MRAALANACFRVAARLAVLGARLQPPAPIAVQVTGMAGITMNGSTACSLDRRDG